MCTCHCKLISHSPPPLTITTTSRAVYNMMPIYGEGGRVTIYNADGVATYNQPLPQSRQGLKREKNKYYFSKCVHCTVYSLQYTYNCVYNCVY